MLFGLIFLSINVSFSILTRPNLLVKHSFNNSSQQNLSQNTIFNYSHISLVEHDYQNYEIEDEDNEKSKVLKLVKYLKNYIVLRFLSYLLNQSKNCYLGNGFNHFTLQNPLFISYQAFRL